MFDQNKSPSVKDLFSSDDPIIGIVEVSPNQIGIVLRDSTIKIINPNGDKIRSFQILKDDHILSFSDYGERLWITTLNRKAYQLDKNFNIEREISLSHKATSLAPLEDGTGIILSYHDGERSWFEHRSLVCGEVLSNGHYGPEYEIISSVAFHSNEVLYFVCCSEHEMCLMKETEEGLVNVQLYSEESGDGELNFSQLLRRSKRFLVDNMTGGIKTSIDPEKYMKRICFMRNDSATNGAIDARDHWVAFLNPNELKIINYNTKKSVKFQTTIARPWHVKILKHQVVCSDVTEAWIFDFRSQSMHFITAD